MSKITPIYVPPIHSEHSGGKLRTMTPRSFSSPHHSHPRKITHKRTPQSLLTNDTKPFTATPLSTRHTPRPSTYRQQSNTHMIITHPIIDFDPAFTENVYSPSHNKQQSVRKVKKSAYLSQTALKQHILDNFLDNVFDRVSLNRVRQHRPISFFTHRRQRQAQRDYSIKVSSRV